MATTKPSVLKAVEERLWGTGEYMARQYTGRVQMKLISEWHNRIADSDLLYSGNLTTRYPDMDLPKDALVENKFKNAIHDMSRLSAEARPLPVFMRRGDSDKEATKALIRSSVVDTIWEMGYGPEIEETLYMDVLGTGAMACALFFNDDSEYAQFMRLDPRYCFPTFAAGRIRDLLYVETLDRKVAAVIYPKMGILADSTSSDKNVTVATLYDDEVVATALLETADGGKKVKSVNQISTWVHELGCVPVAFVKLPSYDSQLRGLFDQLGGPMAIRNRIVSMLDEYLDSMVHASLEQKNILNGDVLPGPLTIYQHDPTSEESFIRRVPPAATFGAVAGILGYMDDQESKEAIQPPSRVGSVSQSIASGSFVASTQGGLSSAVRSLQRLMASFRRQANRVALKIEETHLDVEKPLLRSVKKKNTYTPSKDIDGVYAHRILFGAAAGLDRQYADQRVLQFQGAGMISRETGRAQIDFLDDAAGEQDQIDLEAAGTAMFQRLMADPNVPLAVIANLIITMGEGGGTLEALKKVAPELIELQKQQAAPEGQQPVSDLEPGAAPAEEAAALAAGEIPEGPSGPPIAPIKPFAPPPLQQQIVSNR